VRLFCAVSAQAKKSSAVSRYRGRLLQLGEAATEGTTHMSLRTSTWIPVYGDAFTNREIAAATNGLTRGDVHVGHLSSRWLCCMESVQDGDLRHLSDRVVAQAAGWPGYRSVSWTPWSMPRILDPDRRIHDWDDYAGRLMRKRQADAQRKQRQYDRNRKSKPTHKALEAPSSGLRWDASGDHAASPMEKAARDWS
jgi:hypothetical protein